MATIREQLLLVLGVKDRRRWAAELKAAGRDVEGVGKQTSDALKKAGRAADTESKGIVKSFKSIADAARLFLGLAVVRQVGRTILEIARYSDTLGTVRESSNRLARSIGQDAREIHDAIKRGMQGAISSLDAFRIQNQAILLGIPVTAAQMELMATTALRLGRAVGRGPTESIQDLITGIGRMSPLILDNLGITVNAATAYENYARTLGKTASQLSETEKRQAFFNEVMATAKQRSQELGDVTGGLTEAWARFGVKLRDFSDKVGPSIVESLEQVLRTAEDLLGTIDRTIDRIGALPSLPPHGFGRRDPEDVGAILRRQRYQDSPITIVEPRDYPVNFSGGGSANLRHRWRGAYQMDPASYKGGNLTPAYERRTMMTAEQRAAQAADTALTAKLYDEMSKRPEARAPQVHQTATAPTRQVFSNDPENWGFSEVIDVPVMEEKFEMIEETGTETFDTIAGRFEDAMSSGMLRIEAQLQATGLRTRGIFGGAANIRAGLLGFGVGNSETSQANAFAKAFEKIGFAGQVAAGVIGAVQGLSSLLGFGGPSDAERIAGKSDEELRNIVQTAPDTSDWSASYRTIYGREADLARRELANRQQNSAERGDRAFTSIASASASDVRAQSAIMNTMLAELRHGHLQVIADNTTVMAAAVRGGSSEELAAASTGSGRTQGL